MGAVGCVGPLDVRREWGAGYPVDVVLMIADGDGVILVGEIVLMSIGRGDQIFLPGNEGSKQDLMMSGMDSSSESPNRLNDLADEMEFRLL